MYKYIETQVVDRRTGKIETVVAASENSVCITQTKVAPEGINCNQWFTEAEFKKHFITQ